MTVRRISLALACALLAGCDDCRRVATGSHLIFTLEGTARDAILVTRDAKHWCYSLEATRGVKVFSDRVSEPVEYDKVSMLAFSATSGRCGFWASSPSGGEILAVIDGEPYATEAAAEGTLLWSPDGQHWVAILKNHDGYVSILRDGERTGTHEAVSNLEFEPNSGDFAYIALDEGAVRLVREGREAKHLASLEGASLPENHVSYSSLKFSPSGVMVAAFPKEVDGGTLYVVQRGEELLGRYHGFVVSNRNALGRMIFDIASRGRLEDDGSRLSPRSLVMNEAGDVAWWGRPAGAENWLAYVNGKPGLAFDVVPELAHLVLSRDGTRVAFPLPVREHLRVHLVIDGEKQADGYANIGGIRFSPDSTHIVFWAGHGGGSGWFYVIDGKPTPACDATNPCPDEVTQFLFSEDGRHTLFLARRGGTRHLVLDGEEHPLSYDEVWMLAFAADGETPTYFGRRGSNVYSVVGIY